jgi:hypothetical protein
MPDGPRVEIVIKFRRYTDAGGAVRYNLISYHPSVR